MQNKIRFTEYKGYVTQHGSPLGKRKISLSDTLLARTRKVDDLMISGGCPMTKDSMHAGRRTGGDARGGFNHP